MAVEPATERIPVVGSEAEPRIHPLRVATRWAGTTALVVVVALALAVAIVPALAGAIPLTVLTGSMEPSLGVGSTVVVRPGPPGEIAVGDVITYTDRNTESDETRIVTHRVIGVESGPAFRTQGDANEDPDPGLVQAADVIGVQWYSIPWVGLLRERLFTPPGVYFAAGVLLLLVGLHHLIPRTVAVSPQR